MPSITSLVAAANRLIGVVARGPTPPGRPRTNSPPPHFTPERGTPTIEDPDPTIEEQSAAAFAAFTAPQATVPPSVPAPSTSAPDRPLRICRSPCTPPSPGAVRPTPDP